MFEFRLRAVEKDPEGYYYPRWDLAQSISVKAETQDDAIQKASTVLGHKGSRHGWPLAFAVDDIKEIASEK